MSAPPTPLPCSHLEMAASHRIAALAAAAAAAAVPASPASAAPTEAQASAETGLRARLAGPMRAAGRASGRVRGQRRDRAQRLPLELRPPARPGLEHQALHHRRRAGSLRRPGHAWPPRCAESGDWSQDGTWRGDLYLVGGGDPTFGSGRFARRSYGGGASVETLAGRLERAGILRVTGRVYGDESRFDSLRGGPDSRYAISPYVGPLSGLSYNRGLCHRERPRLPAQPAGVRGRTARRSARAPRDPGQGAPRGPAARRNLRCGWPPSSSPTMARLATLTNKPSDNFFAEMLVKALSAQAGGRGTTARRDAAGGALRQPDRRPPLAASPTARASRAATARRPTASARLLLAMRERDEFPEFFASLSIAGRDGTLRPRMRRGPARGRCRGKTGHDLRRLRRVGLLPRPLGRRPTCSRS